MIINHDMCSGYLLKLLFTVKISLYKIQSETWQQVLTPEIWIFQGFNRAHQMDVGLLWHEGLHTSDAFMHEWSVDQNSLPSIWR